MTVFIRTDASREIGSGHVMRCLSLAKHLRKFEIEAVFISAQLDGDLISRIKQEGFGVRVLNRAAVFESPQKANNSSWPLLQETRWELDAIATKDAFKGEKVDWLVVDHYGIDIKWEQKLRPFVNKILVIDDLANRSHDCDILLDQNLTKNCEDRYDGLVPKSCTALIGPKYALLQSEYAQRRVKIKNRSGKIKRILIYFGGVDRFNLCSRSLVAFQELDRKDLQLDVVLGVQTPHSKEVMEQAANFDQVCVHSAVPSLAPFIHEADLSIGAGGGTTWERCCLGLPSLVVTIADNQIPTARELHRRGIIKWLGHHDEVTSEVIGSAFIDFEAAAKLKDYSNNCKSTVDGLGALRVASAISLNSQTRLIAYEAALADEKLLLQWANDPSVRRSAFDSAIIEPESHKKWFDRCLSNPDLTKIYIVFSENGAPIGQVRLNWVSDCWEIDYSLARFARGNGLGKCLLITALERFLSENGPAWFKARVKTANVGSTLVFDSLGFRKRVNAMVATYKKNFASGDLKKPMF